MSQILNIKDYKILQKLNDKNNSLCGILNRNGMPNATVCPICHVDDFVHVEGCKLL